MRTRRAVLVALALLALMVVAIYRFGSHDTSRSRICQTKVPIGQSAAVPSC